MDEDTIAVREGDAIRLIALSDKGKAIIDGAGSDVWTVLRIQGCVLNLGLAPGMFIAPSKDGNGAKWISFNDPDIGVESCWN